jgi:hypothetical protein
LSFYGGAAEELAADEEQASLPLTVLAWTMVDCANWPFTLAVVQRLAEPLLGHRCLSQQAKPLKRSAPKSGFCIGFSSSLFRNFTNRLLSPTVAHHYIRLHSIRQPVFTNR